MIFAYRNLPEPPRCAILQQRIPLFQLDAITRVKRETVLLALPDRADRRAPKRRSFRIPAEVLSDPREHAVFRDRRILRHEFERKSRC